MARRPELVLLSALLASLLAFDGTAWAQRGRGATGGSSARGGSVSRSVGSSRSSAGSSSVGRSSVQGRSSSVGRSTPAPSRSAPSVRSSPSVGSRSVGRSPSVGSPTTSRTSPSLPTRTYTSTRDAGRSYPSASQRSRTVPDARYPSSTSGRSVTSSPSRGLSPLDDRLRGLDSGGPAAGRVNGVDRLGSSRDRAPSTPDTGLRSRPSTSTATGGRDAFGGVPDLSSSVAPSPRRTPFPSMYSPAPDSLSGARLSARDRLESQSAQRRLATDGARVGDPVRTSDIVDRYSRGAAEPRTVGTGARDAAGSGPAADRAPVATRDSAGVPGLSRARRELPSRADGLPTSGRGEPSPTTGRRAATERGVSRTRADRQEREDGKDRADWQDMRDRYSDATRKDPSVKRAAEAAGRTAGIASEVAFRTALAGSKVIPGVPSVGPTVTGGWSDDFGVGVSVTVGVDTSCWYWNTWYPSFCWSWWGSGWWWSFCWAPCSWYYPYYSYYPYGWCYPYYGYYYPYYGYYYPYTYAYSAPVVYNTYYYGDEYVADEQLYEPEAQQPAVVQGVERQASEQSLIGRATAEYLNLGDRAFREGSYGRAVRYYAKAVEYSPDDPVLYLVLSDALFATGDYHYAAYALRRAFELDPELAQVVIDKRQFYGKPEDFDQQLRLLESYLNDHFLDDDARLVLAANYLFGGAPQKCVELLESPFSLSVRESETGVHLIAAARNAVAAGGR